jgi:hypothetical protein
MHTQLPWTNQQQKPATVPGTARVQIKVKGMMALDGHCQRRSWETKLGMTLSLLTNRYPGLDLKASHYILQMHLAY